MDTGDVVPLIELLDDNIDDLEEALSPLLKNALSDKAGKLPLLDKAQLYVLVTYAIESILFCRVQSVIYSVFADQDSILAVKWRQRQKTPCLSRTNKSEAVL